MESYLLYAYREYLSLCAEVLINPVWNWSIKTLMEVIFPWTFPPSVDRPWYTTTVTSPCKVRFTGNDTFPSPRSYSLNLKKKKKSINDLNSEINSSKTSLCYKCSMCAIDWWINQAIFHCTACYIQWLVWIEILPLNLRPEM